MTSPGIEPVADHSVARSEGRGRLMLFFLRQPPGVLSAPLAGLRLASHRP